MLIETGGIRWRGLSRNLVGLCHEDFWPVPCECCR